MGACALQVGHHEAWIATRIGLPAFCASAKALVSKAGPLSARAGETTMAEAIREAFRIERRDNMKMLLLIAVPEITIFYSAAFRDRGFVCVEKSRLVGTPITHRTCARAH